MFLLPMYFFFFFFLSHHFYSSFAFNSNSLFHTEEVPFIVHCHCRARNVDDVELLLLFLVPDRRRRRQPTHCFAIQTYITHLNFHLHFSSFGAYAKNLAKAHFFYAHLIACDIIIYLLDIYISSSSACSL